MNVCRSKIRGKKRQGSKPCSSVGKATLWAPAVGASEVDELVGAAWFRLAEAYTTSLSKSKRLPDLPVHHERGRFCCSTQLKEAASRASPLLQVGYSLPTCYSREPTRHLQKAKIYARLTKISEARRSTHLRRWRPEPPERTTRSNEYGTGLQEPRRNELKEVLETRKNLYVAWDLAGLGLTSRPFRWSASGLVPSAGGCLNFQAACQLPSSLYCSTTAAKPSMRLNRPFSCARHATPHARRPPRCVRGPRRL